MSKSLGRAGVLLRWLFWKFKCKLHPQTLESLSGVVPVVLLHAVSVPLQNIVSKNAMQYRGNAQHDAQEFLLWLLDRVHEDLNNVVNYSGMPPLKVRDSAESLRGRSAVTLHAVFLFKIKSACWRLNSVGSNETKAWVQILFVSGPVNVASCFSNPWHGLPDATLREC